MVQRYWTLKDFLLEKGDLVVPAVNLGLEPNLTILTQGRPCQERSEGVVAESQDMQDGQADAPLPGTGREILRCIRASENFL